jgi:lipopolysaccharide export system ATP-binding protein
MVMGEKNLLFQGKNLKKSFSKRVVVSGVDLEVRQGEVVGLLGPNGAGKTTTFYMMVGLIKADKGEIQLGDEDITLLPLHKRALKGIGYLPQEASVFRDLSVQDNILAALECIGLSRSARHENLFKLLNDFGLGHIRKSKGMQLSGGERRRVEMARTLAIDPKFVLLDEPFAGVDPLAVHEIQQIIIGLKKRKIGVLITDHNVRETLGIVDRAYIMNAGELLVKGTPDEILNSETARKFYLGEDFKL